jgi:flagellar motor switch protein FliN
MDAVRNANLNWLFERLAARLASVFEAMTGERPVVRWDRLEVPAPAAESETLPFRQSFAGAPGAVFVLGSRTSWTAAGRHVLKAAGLEETDHATLKSTYLEIMGQAMAGIAQEMTARLRREVTCVPGDEAPPPAAGAHWARVRIPLPGAAAEFIAGAEDALLEGLVVEEPATPAPGPPPTQELVPTGSKTFDLLLDVELPVSVSFGRAQVPLKDVLKLTTGSIVELNRSLVEPVEVIVNNCVIARGEVVVVEGNFGVRIQEVISRQERLRTLN